MEPKRLERATTLGRQQMRMGLVSERKNRINVRILEV